MNDFVSFINNSPDKDEVFIDWGKWQDKIKDSEYNVPKDIEMMMEYMSFDDLMEEEYASELFYNSTINSHENTNDNQTVFPSKNSKSPDDDPKISSLKNICNLISEKLNFLSNDECLNYVLDILTRENVESELLDLLGYDHIEQISYLLSNKEYFLESKAQNKILQSKPIDNNQSISISNQMHKVIRDKYISIPEMESLLSSRKGRLDELSMLPHIYSQSRSSLSHKNAKNPSSLLCFSKMTLSQGTIREDFMDHEQFLLPFTATKHDLYNEIINVEISQLSPLHQKAFPKEYKHLNKMQSAVFSTAYQTNENMLICAPTGAGKTDVAMLAILKTIADYTIQNDHDSRDSHEISIASHSSNSNSHSKTLQDQFKIIYIAPMKALATEITNKFNKRLGGGGSLNIRVSEYTGDMQLTKDQIKGSQMIVTTPEKWDVITRKSQGDVDFVGIVKLIIIDEVHLLQDDRGPVLESIIARTTRQVEMDQKMIRIIGLSATLPNYYDVALFLRVNPMIGLFYFDDAFRPVPLTQTLIGVKKGKEIKSKSKNVDNENNDNLKLKSSVQDRSIQENINNICYRKCLEFIKNRHQVLVFVHGRNETIKTVRKMISYASDDNPSPLELFSGKSFFNQLEYGKMQMQVERSNNREIKEIFPKGFGVHHAGLLRQDRLLMERLFSEGYIRVLICTATLAWGINLPAHAVIIKGTLVYDQQKADFVNIGILDVLQIFGRAGRPQFDTHGEAILITKHDSLAHYTRLMLSQTPIESQFVKFISDNLNAEISLGTVSTIGEAIEWLKYTFLYIRMINNPTSYGITLKKLNDDPDLMKHCRNLIESVVERLRLCGMISLNPVDEILRIRDIGRIASNFYLSTESIESFGQQLNITMNEEALLSMMCRSHEFEHLKVREEELNELDILEQNYCRLAVKDDTTSPAGKASILLQTYISHRYPESFSLHSDMNYIVQNAGRILRAIFEMIKSLKWPNLAKGILDIQISFERKLWKMCHPLNQLEMLPSDTLMSISKFDINELSRMTFSDIKKITGNVEKTEKLMLALRTFPIISIDCNVSFLNSKILQFIIEVRSKFIWVTKVHSNSLIWWFSLEDEVENKCFHFDSIILTKEDVERGDFRQTFYLLVPDSLPNKLRLRWFSDKWLHSEGSITMPLRELMGIEGGEGEGGNLGKILIDDSIKYTNLLSLRPLSISALHIESLQGIYENINLKYFNPLQTQTFHSLYHTDLSMIIGAPTGSGKTIMAELAIWRALFTLNSKAVYVAPLKALVKERFDDWQKRLIRIGKLDIKIVELTGDHSPDRKSLIESDIIVTTPEKWDGFSRRSINDQLINQVSLIVMDEIHLLGTERGHVLEIMLTRMRILNPKIRILGLSTAISNANDLAQWLNIDLIHNFRPSVRPVPVEIRIESFPGRHYCPRMALMNKPIYSAINSLSSNKPVLIFVASRRQTRLTAQALVSLCANDDNPFKFIPKGEIDSDILNSINDSTLKFTLSYGISIHHAGLNEHDRMIAETLFSHNQVMLMISTSTLAWGVNFPAHLVIVKGTEYYDVHQHRYVDMPITDILQMIGRAGRPQFDTEAKALVMVQEGKKAFIKNFLWEPFPLESALTLEKMIDHLLAEISAKRICSSNQAIDFVQNNTFLSIRARKNQSLYKIPIKDQVLNAISMLKNASCLEENENGKLISTPLGELGSFYYVNYLTIQTFLEGMQNDLSPMELLHLLSNAKEFFQTPVRHNENVELHDFFQKSLKPKKISISPGDYSSPHIKTLILLISHIYQIPLPYIDWYADLSSVLDQIKRIIQVLLRIGLYLDYLDAVINVAKLSQALSEGKLWQLDYNNNNNSSTFIKAIIKKEKEENITIDILSNQNFLSLQVDDNDKIIKSLFEKKKIIIQKKMEKEEKSINRVILLSLEKLSQDRIIKLQS